MVATLSRKDLIRKFRALGYTGPFSGGKHQFMIKGNQKIRIPNPHVSDISISLVKEILRQAGISPQEWDNV
jgi:predicted RNA binding protein YcfA (HicA-like mRNA interferase family)